VARVSGTPPARLSDEVAAALRELLLDTDSDREVSLRSRT
jgi:hypothetical protein